jgi:hypothetical protein
MRDSTIVRSRFRRWFAGVAVVLGALLVQVTVAAPAHSADLGPYYGSGYPGGGYQCGTCGCVSHCGCGWRCYPRVEHRNFVERRYVVREYFERRFANCCDRDYYRPYAYDYYRPSGYEDGYGLRPPSPIGPDYAYGNGYGNGYPYGEE